jgi:ADP-ribose pyrophosphatase
LDKQTLWRGNFLSCVIVRYSDSAGVERKWEYVERVNCNGIVAIVPVIDNDVLLIRQFRPPVNSYVIEFPAGLNDKGDSLKGAAERELLEETGYSAKDIIFLAEGPLSSGASGEILSVFLAKGLEFKGIGQRDETEDIEVLRLPIDRLYQTLKKFRSEGDYVDLKVPGLMELAKKHLRL